MRPAGSERTAWGRLRWRPYAFVLPALLVFLTFAAGPIVAGLGLACYRWDPVENVRQFVGLRNFAELAADPVFRTALRNNLVWILASVAVQAPLALLLAASLVDASRTSRALRTLVFSPLLVPGVAVGLLFAWIYDAHFGALNAALSFLAHRPVSIGWIGHERLALGALIAVACWQYTGFHTMVLLAGMQGIPPDLHEAAALDGAGWGRRLRHVTLPLLRPVFLTDLLLIAIGSVKIFDLVQVMTKGGPNSATHVLSTYMYSQAFMNQRLGMGAAVAVVMLAVTLALALAHARLARGERGGE